MITAKIILGPIGNSIFELEKGRSLGFYLLAPNTQLAVFVQALLGLVIINLYYVLDRFIYPVFAFKFHMFCFLQTVIRRQKLFFLAEKARNLYPSEIGNFAESPRFFVTVCSLKEQSINIIVDARVLRPSGGYAKLKFFQVLLG